MSNSQFINITDDSGQVVVDGQTGRQSGTEGGSV